jgi:hypothetical protein
MCDTYKSDSYYIVVFIVSFSWFLHQNCNKTIRLVHQNIWQVEILHGNICVQRISNNSSSTFPSRYPWYEPRYDKTNKMGLRPAWTQTSLRIRAVWSGSMLFATSRETDSEQHGSWSDCADAGWSGSMLDANPLCWFCRDAAHVMFIYLCMTRASKRS